VQLGPDANVHGDVTVVGGKLDVDRKARVGGQLNEIGFDSPRIRFCPLTDGDGRSTLQERMSRSSTSSLCPFGCSCSDCSA
jgi:hypothetical protein